MNTASKVKETSITTNFSYAHLELDYNKVLFFTDDKNIRYYERWVDIPLYKGKYQVSNAGRIRSLRNKIIRKCCLNRSGYVKITFKKGNTWSHVTGINGNNT